MRSTSDYGFGDDCRFLHHFPTMDMIRLFAKKDEQLNLGSEGELGKPMCFGSNFKTRLCMSFVAGGGHLAYGKVELRRPNASSEVQDQVVLMLFVMIVAYGKVELSWQSCVFCFAEMPKYKLVYSCRSPFFRFNEGMIGKARKMD